MTSRFFIAERENLISSDRSLDIEIGYPKPIQYV